MNSGNLTKETTALILAGGKGTRIAALVPNLPKPMVDVAGHPFLEWPLRRLAREGFDDILLSVGHMADAVIGWLQNRVPLSPSQNVRWHREAQPWEPAAQLPSPSRTSRRITH
ncbi:MAG: NTP transferase domain-containing protein [Alphaproteobacteria bacterium]|nr:NTP transferase domain-containing protein [Alphaproteobacteria bacterium]